MEIILASKSPRRVELLQQFNIKFRVQVANVPEEQRDSPKQTAISNASAKARAVLELFPKSLIIGADTIVVVDQEILGKPRDREDAAKMLRLLSGRKHHVITGVALVTEKVQRTFYEETAVFFRTLADYEIRTYLNTGEPFDKAGAYAIQGIGGAFVESISGCYYNVVGLPIPRLLLELRDFGIDVFA
ncbi:MAG: septum formation inhibitor Maf [Firmicutes bacterium]|jgi:septum formation protein|nr:septum formation inhibitor Maf [Bacillota bacterium]